MSLIGNKCDLAEQREVEPEEPLSFCRYVPEIMFVMETSAKDNTNVEDTFHNLATELKVIIANTYLVSVTQYRKYPDIHILSFFLHKVSCSKAIGS